MPQTGFLLTNSRPVHRLVARADVIDANGNHITAAQLAVDGEIEESKVALVALDLKLRSDRPHVARSQRRLCADKLPFVSRGMSLFHGVSL